MKKLPRVLPRKPRVAQQTNETAVFAAENPANLDNRAVINFSNAMRVKLAAKRLEGRGGWQDKEQCSNEYLSQLLREHVEKGDPVDVANFAMMIHQRHESIAPAPATKLSATDAVQTCLDIAADYWKSAGDTIADIDRPSAEERGRIQAATAITANLQAFWETLSQTPTPAQRKETP